MVGDIEARLRHLEMLAYRYEERIAKLEEQLRDAANQLYMVRNSVKAPN